MAKTIPLSQFAIVYDQHHAMVISSGTMEECLNTAHVLNANYQTNAYVAKGWRDDG